MEIWAEFTVDFRLSLTKYFHSGILPSYSFSSGCAVGKWSFKSNFNVLISCIFEIFYNKKKKTCLPILSLKIILK